MKKVIPFIIIMLMVISAVSAQNPQSKNDPVGKWKFEAPLAPEGFTNGIITLSFAENKYSTAISFTGSDYKIPGEKVKIEKETVAFNVYIEGNDIQINLKMEGAAKMTGKATYSEGEIPLTLTKELTDR